jgi:3-keto-5-aminohexanoate cleavage enzyme
MKFIIEIASENDWDGILGVLETANMHHIPSKEMPELELSHCFVAKSGGRVIGISGYKMLPDGRGKTTLLAVKPEFQCQGVGYALHLKRIEAMEAAGAEWIVTNADRQDSIEWYKKHFGYVEVATLKKMHEFGNPDVDYWTTMEMDIKKWRKEHGT